MVARYAGKYALSGTAGIYVGFSAAECGTEIYTGYNGFADNKPGITVWIHFFRTILPRTDGMAYAGRRSLVLCSNISKYDPR